MFIITLDVVKRFINVIKTAELDVTSVMHWETLVPDRILLFYFSK